MSAYPKLVLLALALLSSVASTNAQKGYNLPPGKTYDRAIIGFANFQKSEVKNLFISGDSIHYNSGREKSTVHLDRINYIRVKEGTKAKEGALLGGATMLLVSTSAVLQANNDPYDESSSGGGGFIVLFTLGGTALGAIIGSATTTWKSYYVHASAK